MVKTMKKIILYTLYKSTILISFMINSMISMIFAQFKIFNSIISLISVNMMNYFSRRQISTNMFFHHKTMFIHSVFIIAMWMNRTIRGYISIFLNNIFSTFPTRITLSNSFFKFFYSRQRMFKSLFKSAFIWIKSHPFIAAFHRTIFPFSLFNITGENKEFFGTNNTNTFNISHISVSFRLPIGIVIIYFILSFVNINITQASPISTPTIYQNNGTVTAPNLNGNFSAINQVVNGNLDNTNADTTNGYFFYKTVSVLPSAGTQGAVYFLTSDNTLNFDTGSSFNKAVSLNSPTNGGLPYYNSGWNNLTLGSNGLPLVSNGSIPSYGILGTVGGGTGTDLSASLQGAIPYFSATGVMSGLGTGTSGQVLKTQGSSANPVWANSLASVSDYGTSTSTSTARQATTVKVAYGSLNIGASSSNSLSNLPFTSSSSYNIFCSQGTNVGGGVSENCQAIPNSGSAATVYNQYPGGTQIIHWFAIGV